MKYTERIRNTHSIFTLGSVRAETWVPLALLFAIPSIAFFAFMVGVHEATHAQRIWIPFAIWIFVFIAYVLICTYETEKISLAIQAQVEPLLHGLEVSIPLMVRMYPLGVATRLLELASVYDSLCRTRANFEAQVTKAAEETGLCREHVLAMDESESLRNSVRAASEHAENAKIDFWHFVDTTYDHVAPGLGVDINKMPPRPKKWRDALQLEPWIHSFKAHLRSELQDIQQQASSQT